MIKICGGKYRNSNLFTLENKNTRPTKTRIKEAIFNHFYEIKTNSVVLDLFAGSGSLGLEAYSRGANEIYFNDLNYDAFKIIKKNIDKLQCKNCYLDNLDYYTYLEKINNLKFDYIFLDPPYSLKVINEILHFIYENKMLNINGIIVVESDINYIIKSKFNIYKEKKYGVVKITYLKEVNND